MQFVMVPAEARGSRSRFVRCGTVARMIDNRRRLAVGLALLLSGLACSRTPMDEQPSGTTGPVGLQEIFVGTGSMTSPRVNHTATLLNDGKVLIAGGLDAATDWAAASAELYDPARVTFTATGNMSTARWGHTATLLPSGKVLVAGGADNEVNGLLASAELYDPT